MAEIVESQRLEAGGVASALETTAKRRRVEAAAEAVGEYVVVRADEPAPAAEALERRCGLIWKGNLAKSAALRRAELGIPRQCAADHDLPAGEVDARQ